MIHYLAKKPVAISTPGRNDPPGQQLHIDVHPLSKGCPLCLCNLWPSAGRGPHKGWLCSRPHKKYPVYVAISPFSQNAPLNNHLYGGAFDNPDNVLKCRIYPFTNYLPEVISTFYSVSSFESY